MWSLRSTSSKRLGEPVDSEDQFEVSFVRKQTKNLLSDRFLLEKKNKINGCSIKQNSVVSFLLQIT